MVCGSLRYAPWKEIHLLNFEVLQKLSEVFLPPFTPKILTPEVENKVVPLTNLTHTDTHLFPKLSPSPMSKTELYLSISKYRSYTVLRSAFHVPYPGLIAEL